MKCPKHEDCIFVTPHEYCSDKNMKSLYRKVTCKYCLHIQYTHTETCELCKAILPWPKAPTRAEVTEKIANKLREKYKGLSADEIILSIAYDQSKFERTQEGFI